MRAGNHQPSTNTKTKLDLTISLHDFRKPWKGTAKVYKKYEFPNLLTNFCIWIRNLLGSLHLNSVKSLFVHLFFPTFGQENDDTMKKQATWIWYPGDFEV